MSIITTIDVTGMTCGHCVGAVTKELEALDGVGTVTVNLEAGGTSHVTVFSTEPLAEAAVREAIDEAGYDVSAIGSRGAAEEFTRLADVREEMAGVGPQPIEIVAKDEIVTNDDDAAPSGGGCGCGGCGCGS